MKRALPAVLLLGSITAYGQDVFRSVDSDGNITYSETPVPGAVLTQSVELLPAPSSEDAYASQMRYEDLAVVVDQMTQERLAREETRVQYEGAPEYVEYHERWFFISEPLILDATPEQPRHRHNGPGPKEPGKNRNTTFQHLGHDHPPASASTAGKSRIGPVRSAPLRTMSGVPRARFRSLMPPANATALEAPGKTFRNSDSGRRR